MMLQALALFLSVALIGRACGDDHERGKDEVQGVATPWQETQMTTPTLGVPPKVQRKGELHVGQARLVGQHEPVTGKIHARAFMAIRTNDTVPTDGLYCSDRYGYHVQDGVEYMPEDDPCKKCQCQSGFPVMCRSVQCSPPTCSMYESLKKECCEFRCIQPSLDMPKNNGNGSSHIYPMLSVTGCDNVRCDRHEICVHRRKTMKPICVRRKSFRASKRHGHGHNSQVVRSSAKLVRSQNTTKGDLHHKVEKLKLNAQEFKEQHDQKFRISATTDKTMRLRSKKFVSDNSLENNTSDKSNKECRQKDLDGVGRHLLDQFKMSQDEDLDRQKTANKRRKEKRNSTKKELHEDDECICQAPVSWKFQHLDADTDGHLSEKELLNLTTRGVCTSRLIASCDHDNDAALSEKEWCCCFADILPPCLAALKSVPSILVRGQPMVLTGSFVPQCDDDGFYSKVQCHSSTGECWCVDRNGKRLSGAAGTTANPDCAKSDLKMTSDATSPMTRL